MFILRFSFFVNTVFFNDHSVGKLPAMITAFIIQDDRVSGIMLMKNYTLFNLVSLAWESAMKLKEV